MPLPKRKNGYEGHRVLFIYDGTRRKEKEERGRRTTRRTKGEGAQ